MVWLPLGVRLIERATAAGGVLAPIAEEPEGVGATGAPEADAVVGITLFFPLGVDTTIGWDGGGCVEAMMTDIFLKYFDCFWLTFEATNKVEVDRIHAFPDVEQCLRCLRLISR